MMTSRRRAQLLACSDVPRPGELWRVSPLVVKSKAPLLDVVYVISGVGENGHADHCGAHILEDTTNSRWSSYTVITDVPCDASWLMALWHELPWHFVPLGRSTSGLRTHHVAGRVDVLVLATDCARANGHVAVKCLLPDGTVGWTHWASVFTTWQRRRPV